MNSKLPQSIIDRALASDGPRARAEYLNVWREDLDDFIPLNVIEAATDWSIYERPPQPNMTYYAHADAAGGTGSDSFTLVICHRDQATKTTIIDATREEKPKFVPAAVIAELAKLLKSYGITEVYGDSYAIGFHADEWLQNTIRFKPCETSTSENYLKILPQLLAGRVRLVDNATLRNQFANLERRMIGDHEKVSHPEHAGAHDDLSCAVAGAVVAANRPGAGYLESGLFADDTDINREQAAADYQKQRLRMAIYELSGRTLWPT
jgi:hypothetical protein